MEKTAKILKDINSYLKTASKKQVETWKLHEKKVKLENNSWHPIQNKKKLLDVKFEGNKQKETSR